MLAYANLTISLFFSVPVHKVDDITHVNFNDRDHLWYDPNWKNSGSGGNSGGGGTGVSNTSGGNGSNNNAGEEDPMAGQGDKYFS